MAKKKAVRREPQMIAPLSQVAGKNQLVRRRRRAPAMPPQPRDQPGLDRLLDQARRLSSDVAERVRGATKGVEPRIERLLSTLEKQAEARFEHLFVRWIWRLGLVAQRDVRGLSQRIDRLERQVRMQQSALRLKAVPRRPPAKAPSENGSPASDNSAA